MDFSAVGASKPHGRVGRDREEGRGRDGLPFEVARDVVAQLLDGLVAALGLLPERLHHDVVQVAFQLAAQRVARAAAAAVEELERVALLPLDVHRQQVVGARDDDATGASASLRR